MLAAKTNEQYRAFQNEIEFCEKEIRKSEDRILELMSESDPLEKNVKAAEEALKTERTHVEAEKEQARQRSAGDKKAADDLLAERKQIVAQVTPATYKRYENIRKRRRGIAVAEAAEGRCLACHMAMRLQFFQDLKMSNQVMSCESCGRILYYNPPVVVEEAGEAPAAVEKE
jgi:predicted  nucleic acid-binding Zn-ribbon protein